MFFLIYFQAFFLVYPLLAMMEQCLKEISQLTPNLYLASVAAISDEALNKNNINLIINASKELSMFPPKDNRINTIRVPVYDNCEETLYPYFKVNFFFGNLMFEACYSKQFL